MNLLTSENISKIYGDKTLFENISFGINEGDKVGLIGINGTGKSTLLKILAGREEPDTGRVIKNNQIRIEYLSQNPEFDHDSTILEQIFGGDTPVMELLRAYEDVVGKLSQEPEDKQLQEKLLRLNQQMDAMDAWHLENEIKAVLTTLGISDFESKIGLLSGGQRKRVALAGALIRPSDLLILDEPTNHIDNETIGWLEEYLIKRKGALLMITHDRYFLDRVVNQIMELDRTKLYKYTGNYSAFLEAKAEREEMMRSSEEKRKSFLKKELEWIRSGVKARGTKQKARIQRFEERSEEKAISSSETMEISVGTRRLGRKIIELEQVSKGLEGKNLVCEFSYILLRDDRIGIIGPNGSGKSTLLNMIVGVWAPDHGSIHVGDTVKIGYYSQENREMDEELRVIEYIREEAEYITTADGAKITASQMLERFLFPPHMQWTPIGKLSGGEKRRLYLLRVLMSAPNVLLLDEPTNDLDIETLGILEEYLDEFIGPVIAVSHDRYFLDRIAEKLFAFEEQGRIGIYPGNYTDYQERQQPKQSPKEEAAIKTETKRPPKEQKLRFTFKEKQEYEQIEGNIEAAEQKLGKIQEQINHAGSDFVLLQELTVEQQKLEEMLDGLMERWAYLTELAEEIEKK